MSIQILNKILKGQGTKQIVLIYDVKKGWEKQDKEQRAVIRRLFAQLLNGLLRVLFVQQLVVPSWYRRNC